MLIRQQVKLAVPQKLTIQNDYLVRPSTFYFLWARRSMPDSPPSTITFPTNWTIDLIAFNAIMARQQCPQHSCTCGQAQQNSSTTTNNDNTMTATTSLIHRDLLTLPFKSHPLFPLRKKTIIVALLGLILSAASSGSYYEPVGFSMLLLFFSILFCLADLVAYARKKASNPDEDPKWPDTKFMVCDVLLAVLLFGTFWSCITVLDYSWYYTPMQNVLEAYGALAVLVCS